MKEEKKNYGQNANILSIVSIVFDYILVFELALSLLLLLLLLLIVVTVVVVAIQFDIRCRVRLVGISSFFMP